MTLDNRMSLFRPPIGFRLVSKPVERHELLLKLEGWYNWEPQWYPAFKFSCRFKDILRCSRFPRGKPEHFYSCYGAGRSSYYQPVARCLNPNWAIIYTPDKHGNFLGRCFVELSWKWKYIPVLTLYYVYGNKLSHECIYRTLKLASFRRGIFLIVRRGPVDKTLPYPYEYLQPMSVAEQRSWVGGVWD